MSSIAAVVSYAERRAAYRQFTPKADFLDTTTMKTFRFGYGHALMQIECQTNAIAPTGIKQRGVPATASIRGRTSRRYPLLADGADYTIAERENALYQSKCNVIRWIFMSTWGRLALKSVDDLNGIGPKMTAELGKLGLGTVEEIASLRPDRADAIADIVPGLSRNDIRKAVAEAQFHLIGPEGRSIAAQLVESGITTLFDLIALPTQQVVTIGQAGWDLARAATFQLEAARESLQFITLLHLVDGQGVPIPSPKVEVIDSGLANRRPVTVREGDADGWIVVPPLRRDRRHMVSVIAASHRRTVLIDRPVGPVTIMRLRIVDPPKRRPTVPVIPLVLGKSAFLFDEIDFADAEEGEVFRVGPTGSSQVRLLGLTRQILPVGVVTRLVRAPKALLASGTIEGSYLTIENGALRLATTAESEAAGISRGGALAGKLAS